MPVIGRYGIEPDHQCGYFHERLARSQILLVEQIEEDHVNGLLENGYRHFGRTFFRPACRHCSACIPLKVRVDGFRETRSVRKTLNRARHLQVKVTSPNISREAYDLYCEHKRRFADTPNGSGRDTFGEFERAFFYPFPFSRMLEMRDDQRLVAVSHFDLTAHIVSAIYCYYADDYRRYSPGRLAIYHLIRIAAEHRIPYVHLGYYIDQHKHMSYKADYCPNEVLLEEGRWVPFTDAEGNMLLEPHELRRGFRTDGKLHNRVFHTRAAFH